MDKKYIKKLQEAVRDSGLKLRELSEATGIPIQTISAYLTERNKPALEPYCLLLGACYLRIKEIMNKYKNYDFRVM